MSGRANARVRTALGLRIRALRKELQLSQEALGDEAGLSGKFIGEVERGEKSISVDSLAAVAAAMDLPMTQLLDLPSKHAAEPEAEKLIAIVRTIPRKDLARVGRVVRALVAS